MNGGIASSSSRRPCRIPSPRRSVDLVAGPGVEIGVDRRAGPTAAGAPPGRRRSTTTAPAACARRVISATGTIVPEHVGGRGRCRPTWARGRAGASSDVKVELAVVEHPARRRARRRPRRTAAATGTRLEWCSSSVTTTRSPVPTCSRPHVYATRLIEAVALAVKIVSCDRRPQPPRDPLARALELLGRLDRQRVDAAVHRGAKVVVVAVHCLDHRRRRQRRRRRVQIDDWPAVELAAQDRELGGDVAQLLRPRTWLRRPPRARARAPAPR